MKKKRVLDNKYKKIKKFKLYLSNMDKKKTLKVIVPLFFILCLLFGYGIGNRTGSRANSIKHLENALIDGNTYTLSKLLYMNNKKLNRQEVEPIKNFFKGNEEKVQDLIDSLNRSGKTQFVNIEKKDGIFKDKYIFIVNPAKIIVTSNIKGVNLKLNNKSIDEDKEINNLVPGEYELKGDFKNDYGKTEVEKKILIVGDSATKLEFNSKKITINSEFSKAKVFINDKFTGKTVSEFKNIGPIPMNGSNKLYIEESLPWGNFKSKEVVIKDNENITLNIDVVNDKLWDEINESVKNFYESVFKALNEENKELINTSTDAIRNKIYNKFEEDYFIFKNVYNIKSVDLNKEKSSFKYSKGIYECTAICDVNYTIGKDIFGLGEIKNQSTKKQFFTKLVYKDNKWIVKDIENFEI